MKPIFLSWCSRYFSFFHPLVLIFAANLEKGMGVRYGRCLLAAIFSLSWMFFYSPAFAQEEGANHDAPTEEKKVAFDANEVIFDHVLDAHEFHFTSYTGSDGKEHPVGIPLPVILYSPQRGLDMFMSSRFE